MTTIIPTDKQKKGTLTLKQLNKVYIQVLKYEKKYPIKWYWRLTWKFPFIEKYTIIEIYDTNR